MASVVSWCCRYLGPTVDVVGGELWRWGRCELSGAYLVVGEGVCLRHDGGCVEIAGCGGGARGGAAGVGRRRQMMERQLGVEGSRATSKLSEH